MEELRCSNSGGVCAAPCPGGAGCCCAFPKAAAPAGADISQVVDLVVGLVPLLLVMELVKSFRSS
ncbi:MAG: hypothetical protein ACPL3C_12690 [Pyrobaculum sp.]